jgi:hypothetical protein
MLFNSWNFDHYDKRFFGLDKNILQKLLLPFFIGDALKEGFLFIYTFTVL